MNSASNSNTRNFARRPENASNLNHSNSQVYSNRTHLGRETPSSRLLCQQGTLNKRSRYRSRVNQYSRSPHINPVASESADISMNAQQLSTGHTVSTSSSTSEESSTILHNTPNLFSSITGDHHIHNLAGESNEKKNIKISRQSNRSTRTMAIEEFSGHSNSSRGIPLAANETGNTRRSRVGASRRRSARLQRLRSQGFALPHRNFSIGNDDESERNMRNCRNQDVDAAATLNNVPLSNLHNDSITAIPHMNASSSLPEANSISRMNRSMASDSPGDLHDGKIAILDPSHNKVDEYKKKSTKKKQKKSTRKGPEASIVPLSEGKECAQDCCICLEQPLKEELSKLDGCGHLYCFSCIDEWSQRENTCPQCKSRFTKIERVHKAVSRKRRGDNSLHNPKNVKKVANRTQRVNIPSQQQQQQNPLNMIDHNLFHRLNGFSLAINNTFHYFNGTAPRQANATATILAAENAMIAANATMNSIAASLLATSRSTSRLNVAPMRNNNTAPPMRMSSTISSPLGNSGMPAGSSHSSPLVHQTIRMGVSQLISSQLHLPGTGPQAMNGSNNSSLPQAMLPPVNNSPPVHTIRMRISQYINQSNAPIQPHVVRGIFASTGRTLGAAQNLAYPGFSSNVNLRNWPNLNPNMRNVATTAINIAYPSDYPQGGYGSLVTHRNAGSPSRGFHFGASSLHQPPELSFLGGSGIPSSSVRREMMSASVSTRSGAPLNHEFGNTPSSLPGLFVVGRSTNLTPNFESRTVGTSTFSSIPFAANGNEYQR